MIDSGRPPCSTYRLVLDDGGGGRAEVAEVSSRGPGTALHLAQRLYPGRAVEIVENGRSLGEDRNPAQICASWRLVPARARLSGAIDGNGT